MSLGLRLVALALALAGLAAANSHAAPAAPARLEVTRVLAQRLRAGSGEVTFERSGTDPLSGETRTTRGTLALEPPDRAALRFTGSGERVTLRRDGGEWLQPGLQQMVRFGPEQAHGALRWWQLLLGGASAPDFTASPRGARTWVVVARAADGATGDSARVRLGPDGLPDRIEVDEGLGTVATYRLRAWRFGPARGESAFVLAAPRGYEVVALP